MDAVGKEVKGALLLVEVPSHAAQQDAIFGGPEGDERRWQYATVPQTDGQAVDEKFVGKGVEVGPEHGASAVILGDVSVENVRDAGQQTTNDGEVGFVVYDPVAEEWR